MLRPGLDDFGTFDLHLFTWRSLIDDPFCLGLATTRRIDSFPVNAFVHGNDIAGLRQLRSALDCVQRRGLRALVRVLARGRDMKLSCMNRAGQCDGSQEVKQCSCHESSFPEVESVTRSRGGLVVIHNSRDPIRLARMVNKMERLATPPKQ